MSGKRLTPMDAMFLYGETPQTMMHVGGLLPFTPAPDAPEDFLRRLVDEIRFETTVQPPWNCKLRTPGFLRNPVHSWVEDRDFDIDYHVRRSALPHPGDERELGILVSRLHSNPLDLSRPPWEMHLIEGLQDNRFAIYVKIHHALVDGYTAMQLLATTLSRDPESRSEQWFFATPPRASGKPADSSKPALASDIAAILGRGMSLASSVPDLVRSLVNLQVRRDGEFKHLTSSYEAPHSVLNSRIGRNRRFATQQYDLHRLGAISRASGVTVNDVVLAICGGGLRRYLADLGESHDKPLIAFLPVNVRPRNDLGGGNAVGAILATLGTDIEDPLERLEVIARSTRQAKRALTNLSAESILAYSALLMAPAGTQILSALTGLKTPMPFTFNTCVSNVPGPRAALYFRGARLEATYPLSIPIHGMALNITCQSYGTTLNFGFIGDRDSLPHLQRLAVYTGAELDALEAAAVPTAPEKPAAKKAVAKKTVAKKAAANKAAANKAVAKKAPRSPAGGAKKATKGPAPKKAAGRAD